MERIISIPNKLNIDDTSSYQFFAKLQFDIYSCSETDIILNFIECQFLAPAFTAYLGMLRELGNMWGKHILFRVMPNSNLMHYFEHSGLYDYYIPSNIRHINRNSIPFTKVNLEDDKLIEYIDNILTLAPINMSDNCRDSLFKNIYEIFSNATEHSQSTCGVFACGHWMPKKRQLVFSICDTGIGIPRLVKQSNPDFKSLDAITWALQRGNSTKQLAEGAPRGLGMADLNDFIKLNNGSLIIFSNDVYYNCSNNGAKIQLPYDVIGTLITVVITADYEHLYLLKEELV